MRPQTLIPTVQGPSVIKMQENQFGPTLALAILAKVFSGVTQWSAENLFGSLVNG